MMVGTRERIWDLARRSGVEPVLQKMKYVLEYVPPTEVSHVLLTLLYGVLTTNDCTQTVRRLVLRTASGPSLASRSDGRSMRSLPS